MGGSRRFHRRERRKAKASNWGRAGKKAGIVGHGSNAAQLRWKACRPPTVEWKYLPPWKAANRLAKKDALADSACQPAGVEMARARGSRAPLRLGRRGALPDSTATARRAA